MDSSVHRAIYAVPDQKVERDAMSLQNEKTISGVLREVAAEYPNNLAVVDDSCALCYAELDKRVDRTSRYLLACGIKKGTHIGIWGKDGISLLIYFYAIWRIGAIAIPLCTSFSKSELEDCIRTADIEYLVVGSGYHGDRFFDVFQKLDCAVHYIPTELISPELFESKSMSVSVSELRLAELRVRETDVDTILFTSGTTGSSKPVMTTHDTRVRSMYLQAKALNATEQDRFCSVLPMCHCFSLTAVVLAAMCMGACLYFPADRHTQTILRMIETHNCTILVAVPTLFSALLKRIETGNYRLDSLQKGMIGGSTYTPELYIRVCDSMGMNLLPSLGQTEATAGITTASLNDPTSIKMKSIGKFFEDSEGCIMDLKTGEPLQPGSEGEICMRGPRVMKGYYRQIEATRRVIDAAGWLHTGDLGMMDADGYVYYTGRLKDLIIRGGENIAPGELETLLLDDPRISQVKVVGIPDNHYTEEVCACVVGDEILSESDVRSILRGKVAPFKVPRYVVFFDQFPETSVGKTDVKKLRQVAAERVRDVI